MEKDFVILVDKHDNQTGTMEKLEAHKKGILHRAISVFIYNSKGELLIHRRSPDKYHSGGLWTNTCCSHPSPGESSIEAANRRLMEEMGLQAHLKEIFNFTYKQVLDNELTEHELDHVFTGITDEHPELNPEETSDWKYIGFEELKNDVEINPEKYTVWFKMIFEKVQRNINKSSS
jgi:isopentenyl-diphosphate delta-isomerase